MTLFYIVQILFVLGTAAAFEQWQQNISAGIFMFLIMNFAIQLKRGL